MIRCPAIFAMNEESFTKMRANPFTIPLLFAACMVGTAAVSEPRDLSPHELISPSDENEAHSFGDSIAVDGNRMLVGSKSTGIVFVLRKEDGQWIEEARLSPEFPQEAAEFGHAVALNGRWAAVSAPRHEIDHRSVGRVYLFYREDEGWYQATRLKSSERTVDGLFGWAIVLNGDSLIVGAPGISDVYEYTRSGSQWNLAQVVEGAGGRFGSAVAQHGDTMIVGSPTFGYSRETDRPDISRGGAAMIFERVDSRWEEVVFLRPSRLGDRIRFGESVSVYDSMAVVGTPREGQGRVYTFTRSDGIWGDSVIVDAPDSHNTYFGHKLALQSDRLFVWTTGRGQFGVQTGLLHVYSRSRDEWRFAARLHPPGPEQSVSFGQAFAIDGPTVNLGAFFAYSGFTQTGAVFTYTAPTGLRCAYAADAHLGGVSCAALGY